MWSALIGPIVSATGQLIIEVIELASSGNEPAARQKVLRFVAMTRKELDADKREALDILDDRFKK